MQNQIHFSKFSLVMLIYKNNVSYLAKLYTLNFSLKSYHVSFHLNLLTVIQKIDQQYKYYWLYFTELTWKFKVQVYGNTLRVMLVLVDIYQFNEYLFPKKEGINIKQCLNALVIDMQLKLFPLYNIGALLKKDYYIYSNLRYSQISSLIIL